MSDFAGSRVRSRVHPPGGRNTNPRKLLLAQQVCVEEGPLFEANGTAANRNYRPNFA